MINKFDRTSIIKNAMITLLLLLILVVEGCLNFVELKFVWKRLIDVNFWVDVVTNMFLLMLIRTLAIILFEPYFESHNLDLIKEKKKNTKLMFFKDNNFSTWIDLVKNVELKKEAYKKKIIKKLAKLEKKSNLADRTIYYSKEELSKKSNNYCVKKKMYLMYLTDEWLDANIGTMSIKSPRLNPNVFDLPVVVTKEVDKYKIVGKAKQNIMLTIVSAAITMLIINIVRQSIEQVTNGELLLGVIINLVLDLTFMLWQFVNGISNAAKVIDTEYLVPYCNRNAILEDYIYYKNDGEQNKVKEIILNLNKSVQEEVEEMKKASK